MLHPVSPGLERMLAQLTHMVSIGSGIKVDDESIPLRNHFIRPHPEEI